MKKVLVAGTFDHIHPGHIYLLKQAKKKGDFLTVIIARDATVKRIKKWLPKFKEKTRQAQLKRLNIADQVTLGNSQDKLKKIQQINPDIICLGYDQRIKINELKNMLKKLNLHPAIIRIKPFKPHIYKSSKLKR